MNDIDLSYIAEGLRGLAVPLDDLHVDPANARTGHALDRIAASLKAYGQRKPIVVNRLQDGKIEAGNGTYRAAQSLGWSHIAVVYVEDDPATAAAFGIADNRVGEFSEWDEDVLRELAGSVGDLFTGFEPAELNDLVGVSAETEPTLEDPGADLDHAAELLAKWKVEVGQVWRLGNHRIMCGDSTQRADVKRLMEQELARIIWSDPPWNVNYGGGVDIENAQGYKVRAMNNDNLGDKFPDFVKAFCASFFRFSLPGAPIYIVMGAQEWSVIDRELREVGFHWSSTIIWAKDQLVLSRKDYHTQYEPMWYGWHEGGARLVEVEDRKQSDVWFIDRPKKSGDHPTMKPLELVERSLKNSSKPGDLVLDLFAGSGTTLMACERLGRVCRTMDNDPKYVAVCLERWSVATGQIPKLEG
ncbi:MAG: DNA modification methylase [Chloroflexi bacterium]|nr:DNA modification methylase [Chloroflexota bacterium]